MTNISQPILLTKIRPPQPPLQLLRRERLINALNNCRNYRLTLISAGAGYGKTTLLTDFVQKSDLALCWYSLDESDQDPAIFCRYLLHAVRQVYPAFGNKFVELLENSQNDLNQTPVLIRLADTFATDLEELQLHNKHIFRETLVVLDDFQFAESTHFNAFVNRLLQWLPPKIHIIISSRSIPKELMLTKLLAKQMRWDLGPHDLTFTVEEVELFLQKFYNLYLPGLAAQLVSYSEGWITAIILALGSKANEPSVNWRQTLSKKDESTSFEVDEVFGYLADEILSNQTIELQNFLIRTSVLDIFTPQTSDRLLNEMSNLNDSTNKFTSFQSDKLLAQLEASNLFTTRHQNLGQSYFQYHALFRQFLRSKLKQDKSLYTHFHLKAAELELEKENYSEVIKHLVEAEDYHRAASLLAQVGEQLYKSGRYNILATLLTLVPAAAQAEQPHVLNLKARLDLESGQNEAALQEYRKASQLYKKQGLSGYAAWADANQSQLLVRTGQKQLAVDLCNEILNNPELSMDKYEVKQSVALARVVLGTLAMDNNKADEAEYHLQEAARIYRCLDEKYHLAVLDNHFGRLYYISGHLVKSNIYYTRSLDFFVKSGNRNRETYCRTNLAINLYQQGQYREAENQLEEAFNLCKELENSYLQLYILLYRANILRNTQRYTKAEAVYLNAVNLAREGKLPKLELILMLEQSVNALLQNKRQVAQTMIKESHHLATELQLPEYEGIAYLNQGLLEFDNHYFKKALSSFEKSLGLFITTKSSANEARAKLNVASVLMAMGEPKRAVGMLTESIKMVEDLGYEPYMSFEAKWAETLFDYASHKKVNEEVTMFLVKHGYISNLPATVANSTTGLNKTLKQTQYNAQINNSVVDSYDLLIFALNGGQVWLKGKEITHWQNSKAREALYFLAENNGCTRDELIDALWYEDDLENVSQALHNVLYILRKIIAPVEVKLSAGRYRLQGNYWYDVEEFTAGTDEAFNRSNVDKVKLNESLVLYKRDFLDQMYSNWIIERQQELLKLFEKGLTKLAKEYEENKQYPEALTVWRRLLIKDPYAEEAHRAAINCLEKMDNKVEAHLQYLKYQEILRELNIYEGPK